MNSLGREGAPNGSLKLKNVHLPVHPVVLLPVRQKDSLHYLEKFVDASSLGVEGPLLMSRKGHLKVNQLMSWIRI